MKKMSEKVTKRKKTERPNSGPVTKYYQGSNAQRW